MNPSGAESEPEALQGEHDPKGSHPLWHLKGRNTSRCFGENNHAFFIGLEKLI
jgi:hypothetical protein